VAAEPTRRGGGSAAVVRPAGHGFPGHDGRGHAHPPHGVKRSGTRR
jgi:hypothetical protein